MDAFDGLSIDAYRRQCAGLRKRQLLCRLRDARTALEHHGRKSYMGREKAKEIQALEEEYNTRFTTHRPKDKSKD